MRETPLSACEREFILKNISESRRLDGRKAYDYRDIRITFGVSLGCCNVEIGQTRVLAQVSCEVGQPKVTRPHDGVLFLNVELSPMASPAFEGGRQSEESIELSRLMERCLKESRCLDLESLCIVAGEKAWHIRVDIHVLNHEGNILDCSSIAAIAALAHFRRPDVSVQGEEIFIHSMEDRDPVPLSIHHMPMLVSFTFFAQGKLLLVDPSEKEEKVMDGKMVIGMNKHREICTLQITGQMLLLKDQVLRCSNIAVMKVTQTTELILKALDNDKKARLRGEKHGFAELVSGDKAGSNSRPETQLATEEIKVEQEDILSSAESDSSNGDGMETDQPMEQKPIVEILSTGVGAIGEGGASQWLDIKNLEQGQQNGEFDSQGHSKMCNSSQTIDVKIEVDDNDSSEEESPIVLHGT